MRPGAPARVRSGSVRTRLISVCDIMPTILIIEDDSHLREGLELLFQIEGYRTLGADDGLTGIDLARRHEPDVVLTNFQMPGADGLDVVNAIRSDAALADTPIIFLTANHAPGIRERAVRQGADVFVTKPFNTDELIRTVAASSSSAHHEHSG